MLVDPKHAAETTSATNESILKIALDHGKTTGLIKPHDRNVVCQKIGNLEHYKKFNPLRTQLSSF